MSAPAASSPGGKEPERPGTFAVVGLLVGIAATIAAFLVIDSARRIAGGLLIFAGAALAATWKFTAVSESRRYRTGIVVILVFALVGSGGYVLFAPKIKRQIRPAKTVASHPTKPPRLSFTLSSPTKTPWCKTYKLTVSGRVPTGYSIVMFDSAADLQYNFTGPYNFDGTVSPVPRVPGEFTSEDIFVGTRFAILNGKPVSNAGFRAVVIAAVVRNEITDTLEKVVAAPTGWGLKSLPVVLTKKVLHVERSSQAGHCLKRQ
jgi:hypothetical protein